MAVKIQLRKVSIIAERVLRDEILDLLRKHGATGWTLTPVQGEGAHGSRASELEGSNVQIDTLISTHRADRIMDEIACNYFADWSVIVYAADVDVLRAEKYEKS
ncbi:MAG: transcriptional regulator [Verrucomicrobia bacterium]|nr:MAG: transcriptional regulator [Verrucomicrobiota bacterium]